MSVSSRKCLAIVLGCHFISAFAALGMPPFFGLILAREFHDTSDAFTGMIYILPTLMACIAGPFWGMASDRFGKRTLLIRAQLGLALGFLAAGFAPNATVFVAALALQGLLGGTFAASRAYLGTVLTRDELAASLSWTEASPRLALIVAPVCLGMLFGHAELLNANGISPLKLYRYLALLPALAALLIARLPKDERGAQAPLSVNLRVSKNSRTLDQPHSSGPGHIVAQLAQFALGFSATLISPYFIVVAHARFETLPAGALGFLFGLPHFIYLAAMLPLNAAISRRHWLLPAFLCALGAANFAQGAAQSVAMFAVARAASGLAMTACFIAMHSMISRSVRPGREGRFFGVLDSLSKFSTVAGGLGASLAARALGMDSIFTLSALGLVGTAAIVSVVSLKFKEPTLEVFR